MCYSTVRLWRLDKEFAIITSKWYHEKRLVEFGYTPMLEFMGYNGSLKLYPPLDTHKILDPEVVFKRGNRVGQMHRIALGIEEKFEKMHKDRARGKYLRAKDRKKKRIILTEVNQISKNKIKDLSCPVCSFALEITRKEGKYFLFDNVEGKNKCIDYDHISSLIKGKSDSGSRIMNRYPGVVVRWKYFKKYHKKHGVVQPTVVSRLYCHRCHERFNKKIIEIMGGEMAFLIYNNNKNIYDIKYYSDRWGDDD